MFPALPAHGGGFIPHDRVEMVVSRTTPGFAFAVAATETRLRARKKGKGPSRPGLDMAATSHAVPPQLRLTHADSSLFATGNP